MVSLSSKNDFPEQNLFYAKYRYMKNLEDEKSSSPTANQFNCFHPTNSMRGANALERTFKRVSVTAPT